MGWYENGEELKKEIVAIKEAMSLKEKSYELKYNVEVEKKFMGLKQILVLQTILFLAL